MWSAMQLEHMLDDLLATDYEGLLIEHDKFVGTPASPTSICESSPQYDTPDFASNARPQCTTYLPTCPTLSFLNSKPSATSSSPGSNCSDSLNPPLMVALVRYASRSFLAPSLTRCPDTSKMQKALNDAQHHLDQIHREKKKNDEAIERLFDPEWYGAEGEWKKLDRTCIEKEVGECVPPYRFRRWFR